MEAAREPERPVEPSSSESAASPLERIAAASRTTEPPEVEVDEIADEDLLDARSLAVISGKAAARGVIWAVLATAIVQAYCLKEHVFVSDPLTLATTPAVSGTYPALEWPAVMFFVAAPCAFVELVAARGRRSVGRNVSAAGLVACVACAWMASVLRISGVSLPPALDLPAGVSAVASFLSGGEPDATGNAALAILLLGWLVAAPIALASFSRFAVTPPRLIYRVAYGMIMGCAPAWLVFMRTHGRRFEFAHLYLMASILAGGLAPLVVALVDAVADRIESTTRGARRRALVLALLFAVFTIGESAWLARRRLLEDWLSRKLRPSNITTEDIMTGLRLAAVLPPEASDSTATRSLIASQNELLSSAKMKTRMLALYGSARNAAPLDAIGPLDGAIDLDPSFGPAYVLRARSRIALDRGTTPDAWERTRASAIEDLKHALVCPPSTYDDYQEEALWELARLADNAAGRSSGELRAVLARLATKPPSSVWARRAQVRLKALDGDLSQARTLAENMREIGGSRGPRPGLVEGLRYALACGDAEGALARFDNESRYHQPIKGPNEESEMVTLDGACRLLAGLSQAEVRAWVDRALAADPGFMGARGLNALVLLRAGEEWEPDADRALLLDPEEPWALYARAESVAFLGPERERVVDNPEARGRARALLLAIVEAHDEAFAIATLALARLDLASRELDSALARCDRLIELNPGNRAARLLRSEVRAAKGIADRPDPPLVYKGEPSALVWLRYADNPATRRRTLDPQKELDRIFAREPRNGVALYARAVFRYEAGAFAEARQDFNQAIFSNLAPVPLARAIIYRASCAARLGDAAAAQRDLELAAQSTDRLDARDKARIEEAKRLCAQLRPEGER